MKIDEEKIAAALKAKQIRLPKQRRKILAYLIEHQEHPTAEQIYRGLKGEMPTLSRTTVYHTLHLLAGAGIVKVLNIEDNEVRYDIITMPHGHFKCESCGGIFNFEVEQALFTARLPGFQVNDKNLYFKGLCPKCLEINKNKI